jgi:hypothetical protein
MSEPPFDPDDLSGWADDDLVRALRAPGTVQELADEEQYLAAFRASRPRTGIRSLPRRAAGRLGAGGTAVVVTVALSSGVAAAYTGNLPDPVQRVVHSVLGPIGAPAPRADGPTHVVPSDPRTRGGQGSPATDGTTPSSTPAAPTGTTTPSPTGSPSPGSHDSRHPAGGPSGHSTPTGSPSSAPATPTSTPTPVGSDASGMTIAGTDHRAGVGQSVTLSGVVTAVDGSPLPDHRVVLQARGPRHWLPVGEGTSDASGTVSLVTPPLQRSARFRLRADPGVRSAPWPVRMVPTLTTTVSVGGSVTTIGGSCKGCRPGDRVWLYRRVDHQSRLVRRGRLDDSGSVQVQVPTPQRGTRYAVLLPATRRHTAARARMLVIPPAAASVSVTAPGHRVPVGGSLTVSGVVRAADGSPLTGRRVVLQVRGAHRWRGIARAITDSGGSVAFTTPAAQRTGGYRLRAVNGVHSAGWRIVMVPTLSASASPDGANVDLTASAQGGRPGDRVVLLRRIAGQLVELRHGRLDADGSIMFQVPQRRRSTTYVVRLAGTRAHAPATTKVDVPGTG